MHEALDENAGGDDVVGVDLPGLDEMFDLRDRDLARGGHHRIEVSRRLPVDEIAFRIGLPRMDDGNIGHKTALHDEGLAVELAQVLALGDDRANAGPGEKGRYARATRADALGQGALRSEFELEFTGQKLLREELVLANIGRDHLPDLARLEQDAEADAVDARIVGNDRQVFHARFADREDQRFRNAAEAEDAGHDGHAVFQKTRQRGCRVRINFPHDRRRAPLQSFAEVRRMDCGNQALFAPRHKPREGWRHGWAMASVVSIAYAAPCGKRRGGSAEHEFCPGLHPCPEGTR